MPRHRTYTNVSISRSSGQWMVATLLFNLSLLGKPRHPTPDKVVDAVFYRPNVPRHSALGEFA